MTAALTPAHIFKIGLGFWEAKVLLSAVELGLFTELAKGPADRATLSKRFGLHDRSACDIFWMPLLPSNCWNARTGAMATRQKRINFSTRRNQVISAAYLKWPMQGYMAPGVF